MMKNVVSLYKPDMPFTAVARSSFDDALDRLRSVAPRKATIAMLSCVKITSAKGVMTLTATNLDIAMTISMPVAADSSDMTAVIDIDDLRKFLALASGDFLRITSSEDGDRATIYCGGSEMSLPVLPASDWPDGILAFEKKGATWFDMSPSTFRIAIDATLPAVSYEATRDYLCGAYMERHEDMLRMVSTDGHRLHIRDVIFEGKTKFFGGVMLPAPLMEVVRGAVQQRSYGEYLRVTVTADQGIVQMRLADMLITARAGTGTFPDYRRIMPANTPNKITLSAAAVARFIAGIGTGGTLKISAFPETCLLEARDEDVIRRTEVESTLDGEPIQFGVSPLYLKQALAEASPSGGLLTFALDNNDGPMVITGTEKRFKAVVMPRRA